MQTNKRCIWSFLNLNRCSCCQHTNIAYFWIIFIFKKNLKGSSACSQFMNLNFHVYNIVSFSVNKKCIYFFFEANIIWDLSSLYQQTKAKQLYQKHLKIRHIITNWMSSEYDSNLNSITWTSSLASIHIHLYLIIFHVIFWYLSKEIF